MMSKNTYRVNTGKKKRKGKSVFSIIENKLSLSQYFDYDQPLKYFPKAMFILALGVFHVGNNHFTEKTTRKITRLETQVEDLRADYTTLKADYMHARLQSEVADRVSAMGLKESDTPQMQIVINTDEY